MRRCNIMAVSADRTALYAEVEGFAFVLSIASAHTCAITQDGALFCWGELLTGTANG